MLRPSILTFAAVAALTLGAGRADAQGFGRARVFTGAGGPVTLTPGATTVYSSGYAGGISGYVPPYSYYAALPYGPPRQYVGYGSTDIFPFYGNPYGHAYDAWSWSALAAASNGGLLNRYYYPPVR